MAMGRPPKPTHLKVLEGNPGKRAISKDEPMPESKAPSCPAHLDKEAKAEWRRISRQLLKLGLLTEVDRAALAAYCQCWSRWVHAEQKLADLEGQWTFETDKGYEAASPWISIASKALAEMRQYISEFGLSPAARTRIQVKLPEKVDEYEAFKQRKASSG
jgi:P27 family predicted phage terminase small subunit